MSETAMPIHPFNLGWNAREAGKNEDANPYDVESRDWEAWRHGWDMAEEWFEKEESTSISHKDI